MRVLGIDPGLAVTGYGVVEESGSRLVLIDSGVIRTPAHAPIPERLRAIYEALARAVADFGPEHVAIESAFVADNAQAAIRLGYALGVAMLAGSVHSVPVFEYPPRTVKIALVGYGGATKLQVGEMVCRLTGSRPVASHHAADAAAVAICHLHTSRSALVAGRGAR